MNITPIETEYAGRRFRSRLEARWAVFFDSLGMLWEYERDAYALGDGLAYLPDFWLPELDSWIEIKGEEPSQEAHDKAHALANATGKRVYILAGSIEIPRGDIPPAWACGYWPGNTTTPARPNLHGIAWCECPRCGALGLAGWGNGSDLPLYGVCDCPFVVGERIDTRDAPRIVAAYRAALRARFGAHDGKGHPRG